MLASAESGFATLEILREQVVKASPAVTFETLLELLGPLSEKGPGNPMPMKIEAWPGGRWFRDLGNNAGHFWGHVQVIKPPTLLEICGPMFMSYPAANHVQYRLAAEGSATRVKILHRAIGLIPPDHQEGVKMGWEHELTKLRELAESRR